MRVTSDDPRLFIPITLYGREYSALVDTGSVRSYLNLEVAQYLREKGTTFHPSSAPRAQLANGEIVPVPEECTVGTIIDHVWKDFTWLHLPQLSTPIILGIDAIRAWKMSLCLTDFSTDTLNTVCAVSTKPWTPTEAQRLDAFLAEELKTFRARPGTTTNIRHHIRLKDPTPIKQRYMPRNPKMMEIINTEVDQMLADGVIERSHSPWSSPTVIVRKKDGKPRFCIDFRRLNEVTEKDAYPIPYINTILNQLRHGRYFSTIDLKQGYWQVPLTDESKPLTAFTVPGRGLFQFRVMPFGLHAAPATFQKLLDSIIGPEMEPYAFAYLDDIIVVSATFEEHLEHLREVFKRLRAANLTLNPEKCHFAKRSVRYLGHVVSDKGIQTDPDKVAAIVKIPPPRNLRELRQVLGAASWYRRFINGFSDLVTPLTRLLRKNQRWEWTDKEDTAFRKLKQMLTTAPVLACPNFAHPFILQTDASDRGLGAALIQNINNQEHVIAYASRTLSQPEKNYHTTEKECLAIVWGVKKMRPYLEGYPFTVITDHQALSRLRTHENPSGRLARWVIFLQQFDMKIEYRKGSLNQLADALSRQPLPILPEQDTVELCLVTPKRDWYQRMYRDVNKSPHNFEDYKVEDEKLYHRTWDPMDLNETEPETAWKLCVPREQRQQIMWENHDRVQAGHMGIAKTISRVMRQWYWPGMQRDITRYVRACKVCQTFKPSQLGTAGRMSAPRIRGPWDTVAIDVMGAMPRSNKGFCYLVVFQDRLTKWVECRAVRKADGVSITRAFRELVVNRFGCPKTVITDNGTEFVNKLFRSQLAALGIHHQTTPPYTPQANPVERVNRVLKPMLAMYCEGNQRNWDEYLSELTLAINTCRHDSTGYTPAYLNFGRELRIPTMLTTMENAESETNDNTISKVHLERMEKLHESQELARLNIARAAKRQAHHYNLRRRDWQPRVGEKVMRREHPLSTAVKGFSAKLAPRYSGPWTVVKSHSPQVHDLRGVQGRRLCRIHVKDLKPAI